MKQRIIYIVFILFLIPSGILNGRGKAYTVEQIPNVHQTNPGQYVSNPDGILSASAVSRINSQLGALDKSGVAEVAVVAVGSIGTDTPEDFSERLFRRWGIGKKGKDNGLLILLVTDGSIRFEVGYGLEGVLTDAMSSRIQRTMLPLFREKKWDEGMIAGVEAVTKLLSGDEAGFAAVTDTGRDTLLGAEMIVIATFMIIMLIAIIASTRSRKCPRCNHKMKITGQETTKLSPTARLISTVYYCPNCGYTDRKNRTESIGGALAGGMIGGALGRGLGGGGGFGGGGFGGGRSGGGGATGRF